MLHLIKKLLPETFKHDLKDHLGVPSLRWSLKNLKKAGYVPTVVYDIGAYEGYWTKDFLAVFPGADVYMFEAQEKKEARLKEITAALPNTHYAIALLGESDGREVSFVEEETGSRVAQSPAAGETPNRKTSSLDALVESRGWPLPDFLKLDVQGFELEVLKGARKALAGANFCLLEVSLLDLGGQGPLLAEVVQYMQQRQFLAYDISQFIRRPYDKALWQIDLLFVRSDSRFIAEKRWS